MPEKKIFRNGFMAVCLAVSLLVGGCNFPWQKDAFVPISQPQTDPYLGDYGDAPDGSQGMDTGYYGFVGGPWVFTLQSMGVRSQFPTLRH